MAVAPGARFRAHFHNTRNTGLANHAATEAGVQSIDASAAGLEAVRSPRATGNVLEDLVYMLDRMGIKTGIDIESIAAGEWIGEQLGHAIPAMIEGRRSHRRSSTPDPHRHFAWSL